MKLPAEKCFIVDAKSANIFGWLENVIMTSQPYSFVGDKLVNNHSKLDHICRQSFVDYMQKLSVRVEEKI